MEKKNFNYIIPRKGGVTVRIDKQIADYNTVNDEYLKEIDKCLSIQEECSKVLTKGHGERDTDTIIDYGSLYNTNNWGGVGGRKC